MRTIPTKAGNGTKYLTVILSFFISVKIEINGRSFFKQFRTLHYSRTAIHIQTRAHTHTHTHTHTNSLTHLKHTHRQRHTHTLTPTPHKNTLFVKLLIDHQPVKQH